MFILLQCYLLVASVSGHLPGQHHHHMGHFHGPMASHHHAVHLQGHHEQQHQHDPSTHQHPHTHSQPHSVQPFPAHVHPVQHHHSQQMGAQPVVPRIHPQAFTPVQPITPRSFPHHTPLTPSPSSPVHHNPAPVPLTQPHFSPQPVQIPRNPSPLPRLIYNNNQFNHHQHEPHDHLLSDSQHQHVHHVSHDLPGESSIAIQRFYVAPPASPSFLLQNPQPSQLRRKPKVLQSNQPAHQPVSQTIQHPTVISPTHQHLQQNDQLPSGSAHVPEVTSNQNSHHHHHESHHSDKVFSPFDPRFKVGREEVSDDEWQAEILASFHSSGLIPQVIPSVPKGLVNINFGTHNCVHMGTELEPEISAYEPSAVSYPAEEGKHYTLIVLDVDNGFRLHWLVVNIPGADVTSGAVISEYASPTPAKGQAPHRFVFVAYEQTKTLKPELLEAYITQSCQIEGRNNFNLNGFVHSNGLKEDPIAANYFTVKYDDFVDSIIEYCADQRY